MAFMRRRRTLLLAPFFVLSMSFLRVKKGQAETNPAAKAVVLDMADFTGKSRDHDTAFEQALASIGKMAAEAKARGELTRAVLNLQRNTTYRIKRPIEVAQLDSLEIDGHSAEIINTMLQSTLHIKSCSHLTIRDLSVDYGRTGR
jgi:hypothetical protein